MTYVWVMERQSLRELIDLQRQQLALMQELIDGVRGIASGLEAFAASPLLTKQRIYKQEAIELLGISPRTYDRLKASGLLNPRGIGHDFYHPEDLEEAMAESRRKGRI